MISCATFCLASCGPLGVQSTQPAAGSGNGEGYPGGDELISIFAGKFYFQRPEYTNRCRDGRTSSYKYAIEISKASRAATFGNGCDNRRIKTNQSLRNLDFAPYNPNFFTKGRAVYSREGYTTLDGEDTQVMALCRRLEENGSGIDIVWIQTRETKKNVALVYWQNRESGVLAEGEFGPVPVEASLDGTVHTINGAGISMSIDSSVWIGRKITSRQYNSGSASIDTADLKADEPNLKCAAPF